MRRLMAYGCAAILMTGFAGLAAETPDETAALRADTQFLRLIDAGSYPEAWKSAAKMMQSATSEEAFAKAIGGARAPLGAAGERALQKVQSATQLPSVPDGHYVIAQYAAHFVNKPQAVETVVTSEEADGSWHVLGYFIR